VPPREGCRLPLIVGFLPLPVDPTNGNDLPPLLRGRYPASTLFINKIKHYRRVATRYEKTVMSFPAVLFLVAAMIWLK
jgi:hypothetical protein